VLALTGVNDPKCRLGKRFKMVASSGKPSRRMPVLMRVSYDPGHGGGTALSEWTVLTETVERNMRRPASLGDRRESAVPPRCPES